MLDQDARPQTAPLPEPATPSAPRRRRGAFAASGIVLVAVALAAGFGIGRATDNGSSSKAVTTRPAADKATPKQGPSSAAPKTTVPTLAFGEAQESQPDQPLDNATRTALAADMVEARTAALRYPTVADARAAGLMQAGEFAPGAGAHFIDMAHTNNINPDGSVDPTNPGSYIYDGVNPSSRLVGLMYISLAENPPAGFPGPNDHWHRHSNLCIKYGPSGISVPFAPDRDVTRAQCNIVHGQFMKKTVWMVHAWVVPGWESPKGVFAHSNPDLTCKDGTFNADKVGFCPGN